MLFTFKNIGIVREASVKLDGLTVIGGENDTGKSTVGKLLFAIVKGISRFEQDLKEGKKERIKELQIKFSRIVGFHPKWERVIDLNEEEFKTDAQDWIGSSYLPHISPRAKEDAMRVVAELRKVLFTEETHITVINRALTRAFHSEFQSELTPKFSPKSVSEINLWQGETHLFNARLEEDKIITLEIEESLLFEDVTFIETPVVLQLYNVLNNADTLLEMDSEDRRTRLASLSRPKVALHLKDLISKIENAQYQQGLKFNSKTNSIDKDLPKKIAKIIGGEFLFDNARRDFFFSKKKGQSVRAANTASGIKSFGLIQLLIETGFLDAQSLLFVDEPETHLHPKWQVEYARLLVEMVKHDIPVMCTSHSPYLIQALKVFSEQAGIADRTNFYLAEREDNEHGTAVISDVTDNLNRLFQKLAEPLRTLAWQ